MKNPLLIAGALLTFVSCAKQEPKLPPFIHATYTVQELLSQEELSRPDYGTFDMMYLMAMPEDWAKQNYDTTRAGILACADSFKYTDAGETMAMVPEMMAKAHDAGTPVLLSCSGNHEFLPFIEKPERLRRFADYMVRLVETNDYDGIDMDWEISLDKALHLDLMADIRRQLDSLSALNCKRYYVTSALSIDHAYTEDMAARLSAVLDWVNIMSYDMCDGIWGTTPSHNTSMAKLKQKLENWKFFSREKLCLGLANYGFYYKGLTPGQETEGPLSRYGRYIKYREFLPLLQQGWTEEYDPEAEVSYFFSPDRDEFVTIEKPETIKRKIEWITAQGFRGVFWWEYHHDRLFEGLPEGAPVPHALIDVVTEYLK